MNTSRPFELSVEPRTLDNIYQRVVDYPWHEMPSDGGWAYGTNLDYLRDLCDYWVSEFNWQDQQDRINRFDQYTAEVDGIALHYIVERGSSEAAIPLILSHGWPGSVVEFLDIIEPLAHPERFGGRPEDSFTVVAPSLPGFGFSGAPARPIGPRRIAAMFHQLMHDELGFDKYIAQGGDWGGAISSWLGFDHAPACQAIHLNIFTMRPPGEPQGEEELAWARQFAQEQADQDGYRVLQATKPQTLSYAMMDSPVGVAAWIIEKFHGWSDLTGTTPESVFRRDDLLTNIMVYILTRTFNTASWIYYGRREEGGRVLSKTGERVQVPTGCAVFPAELLRWPPRSMVERVYNVTHWTQMPRGGHFAAMEQPELLLDDIRRFARPFRHQ